MIIMPVPSPQTVNIKHIKNTLRKIKCLKNTHIIWQGLKTATVLNCELFKYSWWDDNKAKVFFHISKSF